MRSDKLENTNPEETVLESTVTPPYGGWTLINYIAARFRYHDRDSWISIIAEGRLQLNGRPAMPESVLKPRDRISFRTVLKEPPVNRDITLLHEEEGFMVISKPPHLPSHADGNFIKNTLIYILSERMREKGLRGKLHLAHRLDRETSGVMLIIKEKNLVNPFMRLFQEGGMHKEYAALARGRIAEERFSVEGFLIPDKASRISFRKTLSPHPAENGIASHTDFLVMERFPGAALLKAIPSTGRTNQIRIHLAHVGHPLLGDKLYGRTDEEYLDFIRRVREGGDPFAGLPGEPGRHMLHASRLTFRHPRDGRELSFEAPLPEDMIDWRDRLRRGL